MGYFTFDPNFQQDIQKTSVARSSIIWIKFRQRKHLTLPIKPLTMSRLSWETGWRVRSGRHGLKNTPSIYCKFAIWAIPFLEVDTDFSKWHLAQCNEITFFFECSISYRIWLCTHTLYLGRFRQSTDGCWKPQIFWMCFVVCSSNFLV